MRNQLHRLLLLFGGLLLIFFTGSLNVVWAQTSASVNLTFPDTSKFPLISAFLDIHNAQGNFIRGLKQTQVTILEDNQRLAVKELSELNPGVQFILALNPGRSMAIRNAEGVSRYDLISMVLRDWIVASGKPSQDDLSLLISGAPEITHLPDTSQWQTTLDAYQLETRGDTVSLDVLTRALEIASDPTTRSGMGRVVVFITSPPDEDVAVGLQSLAGRANQQGIHINIVLVSTPDMFLSPVAIQLHTLAEQTNGKFFGFSGVEDFPNFEDYLENSRHIYSLLYESRLATPGDHQIGVEVQVDDQLVSSTPLIFNVNVQAPVPIFVSPPTEISRASLTQSAEEQAPFFPVSQPLDILVEFPDGFPRSIVTATLYVDNAAIIVNTKSPFEHFNWDISQYTTSGEHHIRVEVVDSLGIQGTTIETPVHITVVNPSKAAFITRPKNRPFLAVLAILLAGSVLALVLILGGRIKPRSHMKPVSSEAKTVPVKRLLTRKPIDPLTQPLPVKSETAGRHLPLWMDRFQWPQRRSTTKAIAFLVHLTEDNDLESGTVPPIPLTGARISVGRDPIHATLVIDNPSIEPLHAILQLETDTYRLSDAGSVGGTWVNYAPVSQEGTLLEHGDLIHIGRVGFRFTLRQPSRIRKPVIMPEEPPQ